MPTLDPRKAQLASLRTDLVGGCRQNLGMSSRVSSFGSLSERVRTTPVAMQDRSAHVWVDGDRPGVLLSWQRIADGSWTALVAFVKEPGQLTVECLPSARVRPT